MLYPIELLRHKSHARNAMRWTACMLTGGSDFVMSSVGFLSVGRCPSTARDLLTVQIASPQKAIIANCNETTLHDYLNSLFLKDLIAVRLLARRLLQLFSKNNGGQPS